MSSSDKALIVAGAAYGDVADAMADYTEIRYQHGEGGIGDFDAAVVTREHSGMLVLSEGDSSGHFKGAAAGAVVGAVLGAVFPPGMLGMAALGAGAGALAGGMSNHISRGDIKELGDLLNPGESGILLVTDRIDDEAANALMPRASRKMMLAVEGDAEAIKAAVRESVQG